MGLFFDKKPLVPGKPEPFKKPEIKPKSTNPLEGDWFKGKPQIPKVEIERFFKDPKVRYGLKKELGLPLNDDKKLNEKIDGIKKMIVNRFGTGPIDLAEAKRSLLNEDWKIRRQNRVPAKTWQERKERMIEQKSYEFLKKKFGIK